MNSITITETAKKLPALIDAPLRGEEIIITDGDDRSLVRLTPATSVKPRPKFGSAKGLIEMSDDFDEPLEDFKDYI